MTLTCCSCAPLLVCLQPTKVELDDLTNPRYDLNGTYLDNHQHWSDEFYLATYIAGRNKVFAEQNSDILQKINHHPERNMYREEYDVLKSNVARVVIIDLIKWMGFKDAIDEEAFATLVAEATTKANIDKVVQSLDSWLGKKRDGSAVYNVVMKDVLGQSLGSGSRSAHDLAVKMGNDGPFKSGDILCKGDPDLMGYPFSKILITDVCGHFNVEEDNLTKKSVAKIERFVNRRVGQVTGDRCYLGVDAATYLIVCCRAKMRFDDVAGGSKRSSKFTDNDKTRPRKSSRSH